MEWGESSDSISDRSYVMYMKTDDIQTVAIVFDRIEGWAETVENGARLPKVTSHSWEEFRYLFKPIPASFSVSRAIKTNLLGFSALVRGLTT
jgi:hypothetical protein